MFSSPIWPTHQAMMLYYTAGSSATILPGPLHLLLSHNMSRQLRYQKSETLSPEFMTLNGSWLAHEFSNRDFTTYSSHLQSNCELQTTCLKIISFKTVFPTYSTSNQRKLASWFQDILCIEQFKEIKGIKKSDTTLQNVAHSPRYLNTSI